jgi:hypothetical protein
MNHKKKIYSLLRFFIFIFIVNLPFLGMSTLLGSHVFIDSFEHPQFYQYIKTDQIQLHETSLGYLVIQTPSHPDFSLTVGDTIFYHTESGELYMRSIVSIEKQPPLKMYTVYGSDETASVESVISRYILGKVITSFDDSIWNRISVYSWDVSVNRLNIGALFVGD